jgi:hypothetical protein
MANFKLFALFALTLVAVANAGPSKGISSLSSEVTVVIFKA